MNVFAKFDEIPSKILKVIKETKRNGHTHTHTHTHTVGRTDNVKTVYPPTNTVCGGYNEKLCFLFQSDKSLVAVATSSSHRLIMGKEEIDSFFLSRGYFDFFLQKCLLSSPLLSYDFCPNR